MPDDLKTRESLLMRLKNGAGDQDWTSFYQQYGAMILGFCRKKGLDDPSARDVLQETMILVLRKLPGFSYNPALGKFRNWLLTLVQGKIRDSQRRTARYSWVQLESLDGKLRDLTPPAGVTIPEVQAHEEAEDIAWKSAILEEALRRIGKDSRTGRETLEIFLAYAVHQEPVSEVARRFGKEVNAIYQIKARIIDKLRKEVSEIENSLRDATI